MTQNSGVNPYPRPNIPTSSTRVLIPKTLAVMDSSVHDWLSLILARAWNTDKLLHLNT